MQNIQVKVTWSAGTPRGKRDRGPSRERRRKQLHRVTMQRPEALQNSMRGLGERNETITAGGTEPVGRRLVCTTHMVAWQHERPAHRLQGFPASSVVHMITGELSVWTYNPLLDS